MESIDWVHEALPEMLWLALLIESCGYRRGRELAIQITEVATSVTRFQRRRWFARTSQWEGLTPADHLGIVRTLRKSHSAREIAQALCPLARVYPQTPMAFLVPQSVRRVTPLVECVKTVRSVLSECCFRREKLPTLAQAAFVESSIRTDAIAIAKKVKVPDFDILSGYPEEPDSDMVATHIRALINGIITGMKVGGDWVEYFWKRGADLAKCKSRRGPGLLLSELPDEYLVRVTKANLLWLTQSKRLLNNEFGRLRPALRSPGREEVVHGLLAKMFRMCVELMTFPPSWTRDMSELLMRVIADTYITGRWMVEKATSADAEKFIAYGAGLEKLQAENTRVALEQAGVEPTKAKDLALRMVAGGISRREELTTVSVGSWDGKDARTRANELGCHDVYSLVYSPCSASLHAAFSSLVAENLTCCLEPLHGLHRIPVLYHKPPITDWGYNTALSLLDDLLKRWIVSRGGTPPKEMPGQRHIARIARIPLRTRVRKPASASSGSSNEK